MSPPVRDGFSIAGPPGSALAAEADEPEPDDTAGIDPQLGPVLPEPDGDDTHSTPDHDPEDDAA